ncbi:MAG: sugar phosphate isomerase/epimerase [Sulfolobales archaeon]|nr:sugar phosphate isomerase/epimerase [Sulfolobales archaeon]
MKVYVTLWYKDFRRRSVVEEVLDGGFDGFELSLDYPLCGTLRLERIPQIKDLSKAGLGTGIHLPWREVYLASPIEEIRRTSLNYVVKCLAEAMPLNPTYAVLHLVTDQATCSNGEELCLSAAVSSLEVLVGVAEEYGVRLYVETTRNYCCGSLEHSVRYPRRGLGVCLDIPHVVERYSRLLRRPVGLSEIVASAPPASLEVVECVHLHGYSMSGYHVVESHIEPSREVLGEYLEVLKSGRLKPRYTVLESFFSSFTAKQIRFSELRWCVDELKKNYARYR